MKQVELTGTAIGAFKALVEILVAISLAIGATISAWLLAIRARRRIKRALGSDASDADLLSLNTWIRVEDSEQKQGITDGSHR